MDTQNPFNNESNKFNTLSRKSVVYLSLAVVSTMSLGIYLGLNAQNTIDYLKRNFAAENKIQINNPSLSIIVKDNTSNLISLMEKSISSSSKDASIIQEVKDIASTRKKTLLQLVKKNPSEFLRYSIPTTIQATIGLEDNKEVEKDIDIEGKISLIDTHLPEPNDILYFLVDKNNIRYQLYFVAELNDIKTGDTIKIRGIRLDNNIVVDNTSQENVKKTANAQVNDSTNKNLLVMMINFQDDQSKPFSEDDVTNTNFNNDDSLTAFYKSASYNKLNITGKNIGYITLPINESDASLNCPSNIYDLADQSDNIAKSMGIDLTQYSNTEYFLPTLNCGGAVGYGEVGGSKIWILGLGNTIISHEFGHNLGANHANSLDCYNIKNIRVSISNNCKSTEYADSFEIMGSNFTSPIIHPNAYHKEIFKFFADKNIKTITKSGNYKIYPLELATTNTQAIKVVRRTNSLGNPIEAYYLEYRQPLDKFDRSTNDSNVYSGVLIHKAYSSDDKHSYLIDNTASTNTFLDSTLLPGQTFTDKQIGLDINLLNIVPGASGYAQVNIKTYDSITCQHYDPRVVISPNFTWEGPGVTIPLKYSLTNNNNMSCPPSKFTLRMIDSKKSLFNQKSQEITPPIKPGDTYNGILKIKVALNTPDDFYTLSETIQDNTNPTYFSNSDIFYINIVNKLGPCNFTTSPQNCQFNTVTYTNINGDDIEIVNAYGRQWAWYQKGDNKDTIWNMINGKDLKTINKYTKPQDPYGIKPNSGGGGGSYLGPCNYIPHTEKYCIFNTHSYFTSGNDNIESVTAYGYLWNYYAGGDNDGFVWNKSSSISLTSIAKYSTSNHDGPCDFMLSPIRANSGGDGGPTYCKFDTRSFYSIDGKQLEEIIAYGKVWIWDNDGNIWRSINGIDLNIYSSLYKDGPCKLAPTGETCMLNSKAVFNDGTYDVESIIAYGKIWDWITSGDKKGEVWNDINGIDLYTIPRYRKKA